MATDFFRQQDLARRNTGRLVLLFALAVLGVVVSVLVFAAALTAFFNRDPETHTWDWAAATDPHLLILVLAGVLVVVVGGSLIRIAELRAGGRLVAEELGGRLLNPNTSEPSDRRLLNVVEEMAIASRRFDSAGLRDGRRDRHQRLRGRTLGSGGGHRVTRGAATALDRDELQGVIAHEFSHILNGDMRLNFRLMGMLHGLFLIGALGYVLLRVRVTTFVVIGAGLSVVGFSGTFFGT